MMNVGYFSAANRYNPFGHMWSLSIEEQFYLIFIPLMMVVIKKKIIHQRKLLILIILMLITYKLTLVGMAVSPEVIYLDFLSRAWALIVGVSIHYFRPELERLLSPKIKMLRVVFIVSLVSVPFLPTANSQIIVFIKEFFAVLVAVYFIILSTCKNVEFSRAASFYIAALDPIRLFGIISYGFYLFHVPVIVLMRWSVGTLKLGDILFAFFISLLIAMFSYHFIEKRIIALGKFQFDNK
jgi:peptidoglycan/LPS O-acetylase OafA/YrhL